MQLAVNHLWLIMCCSEPKTKWHQFTASFSFVSGIRLNLSDCIQKWSLAVRIWIMMLCMYDRRCMACLSVSQWNWPHHRIVLQCVGIISSVFKRSTPPTKITANYALLPMWKGSSSPVTVCWFWAKLWCLKGILKFDTACMLVLDCRRIKSSKSSVLFWLFCWFLPRLFCFSQLSICEIWGDCQLIISPPDICAVLSCACLAGKIL